jgi:hypothetical protein
LFFYELILEQTVADIADQLMGSFYRTNAQEGS